MPIEFLSPTKAKMIDVNTRSEKHGDLLVPGIDLRFQFDVPNTILMQYDPALREALFTKSAQAELPGVGHVSDMADLRFPRLDSPLHWNEKIPNYSLTIDYGLGGESNIELNDCNVHKHVLTPRQGGTCTLAFTVSCSHNLTEQSVGKLGTRVQHDVHILLRAGEVVES